MGYQGIDIRPGVPKQDGVEIAVIAKGMAKRYVDVEGILRKSPR
jgi:hypothetical protein